MKAGIGYCEEESPFSSGQNIVKTAIKNGDIENVDFILAFSHGYEDIQGLFEGIKSITGTQVPVIGGSSAGIITNDRLSYQSRISVAAVIETEGSLEFRCGEAGNLDKDERASGELFAKRLLKEKDDQLLILFYDFMKQAPSIHNPLIPVSPTLLIEGIENVIGSEIPIIGAGITGDISFTPSKQFCSSHVRERNITGAMLSGSTKPYIRITHGQIPLDGIYHRVTNADGNNVYELDGIPVSDMIDELYGKSDWRDHFPIRMLSIARNYGKKFGELNEAAYVSKVIMSVTPDGKGMVLSEAGLEEGDEILFMLRDVTRLMESTKNTAEDLINEILSDGKRPLLGLYVDCGGRTAFYLNSTQEEATELQSVFNAHGIPLIGIYSGCEIAPLMGRNRSLSYTGVIMVLAGD